MKLKAVKEMKLAFILAILLSMTFLTAFLVEKSTCTSTTLWCQEPIALAFDGSNIWVADGGVGQWSYVHQIRAHDGEHLRTIALPEYSRPNDLIFDGTSVWVSCFDNAGVFEIEIPPSNAEYIYRADYCYGLPDSLIPAAMTFDGENLWVADWVHDAVVRMRVSDKSCREWLDTVHLPDGSSPSDLTFDGENIWVSNYGTDVVMKINTFAEDLTQTEEAILETIPVSENPSVIACDEENIWVTHGLSDLLTKIRIVDSFTSTIYLPDGSHPNAIAFDRVNMWVANVGQQYLGKPADVMKLSSDGTELDTFTLGLGDNPTDLVFDGSRDPPIDGSYVWVACPEGHYLRKLPASTYQLTLRVSGQYGLSSGDPIKGAEVRLYSHWSDSWQLPLGPYGYAEWFELASVGQTDNNGEYFFEVPWGYQKECMPPAHPKGATNIDGPRMFGVHVEVLARNEAADVRFWDGTDLRVADKPPPTDETLTYVTRNPDVGVEPKMIIIDDIVEEAITEGQTEAYVDLGYAQPSWEKEGAFHILNTIGDAWDFLVGVETDIPYCAKPPPVIVAWSKQIGAIDQCVHGQGAPLMLQIGPWSAQDPYTILHEYGHYIANMYNFDRSLGGEHGIISDEFAWSEGWAYFFSDYVRHVCYYEPFDYVWEHGAAQGSDYEYAILQLLTGLCVDFGFERIWDVCYNHSWYGMRERWSGPATIHEFWDEWFEQCETGWGEEFVNLTLLFSHHGIDKICANKDNGVRSDIEIVDPREIDPGEIGLPVGTDLSNAIVVDANVIDNTPEDQTDDAYTDIAINMGVLDVETCRVYKQGIGPLEEVGFYYWPLLPTVSPPGEPVFARNVADNLIIVRLYVGDPLLGVVSPILKWTFHVVLDDEKYPISISSNSTISDFNFTPDEKEISFNVTCSNSTLDFCNVTIPMNLMIGDPWLIHIDSIDLPQSQSVLDNGTHTYLYFTYAHTTSSVTIRGTWVVPEFPVWQSILIFLVLLSIAIAIDKRRRKARAIFLPAA